MGNSVSLLSSKLCDMLGVDALSATAGIITAIVLVVIGAVVGLLGKKFYSVIFFVCGLSFGFGLALSLVSLIGENIEIPSMVSWIICAVFAIVCAFLIIKMIKAGIFIASGLIGLAIGYGFTLNWIVALAGFVIFGILGLFIAKFIVRVYFALVGGFMVAGGITMLAKTLIPSLNDIPIVGGIIFLVIGIGMTLVFWGGAKFSKKKRTDNEE